MKKILIYFVILIFLSSCKKEPSDDGNASSLIKQQIGIIVGDVVNVRKETTIKSEILATLQDGEHVEIVSNTNKKMTIGKFTDNWFFIKTSKGISGYVFGAFIFELDELFKGYHWNYITYSEWAFGLKFKRDYTGLFVYSFNKFSKSDITFSIDGSRLKLDNVKADFLPSKLYFFRYKGKNYLTKKKIPFDIVFENEVNMTTELISNTYQSMENFLMNTQNSNNQHWIDE